MGTASQLVVYCENVSRRETWDWLAACRCNDSSTNHVLYVSGVVFKPKAMGDIRGCKEGQVFVGGDMCEEICDPLTESWWDRAMHTRHLQ
jgi:hypothetical protein